MKSKKIFLLLVLVCAIPCFAARCLKCGRTLVYADRNKVCNLCIAGNILWRSGVTATWEIDYASSSGHGLSYAIYSSKTSFDTRNNDPIYINNDGKLMQIQNYKYDVGEYIFKMPLSKNPYYVNVVIFDDTNNWTLKRMPLATKSAHYINIILKKNSNNSLSVRIFGGESKYSGQTLLGSATFASGTSLDCSSLAK